jgi:ubiquinone/menaquinone biosynthesis C-methylase UbiE
MNNDELEREARKIIKVYAKRNGQERYARSNLHHRFEMFDRLWRILEMLDCCQGVPDLSEMRILDVGCGGGGMLRDFIQWGAQPENIAGIDIRPNSIAEARRRVPSAVRLCEENAASLSWPDASFDMVLQSTVFTSILNPEMRQRVANEMLRVLTPNGIVLWYDFLVNNPRNPDVRGVKKREIMELFPNCRIKLRRITLAPPIGRWVAPRSWALYHLLYALPFLRTHYLGIIAKIPAMS